MMITIDDDDDDDDDDYDIPVINLQMGQQFLQRSCTLQVRGEDFGSDGHLAWSV